MPIITPENALVIGAFISPLLFLMAAWITHASRRRIFSALFAGIVFGIANAIWDQIAFLFGWWSYPAFFGKSILWLLYIPAGLVSGGAFGLIGWKIFQRFGRKGLFLFLFAWTIWGVLHDFGGGQLFQSSNLIRFANGTVPIFTDALLYASCGLLAQLTIRFIGGPAREE